MTTPDAPSTARLGALLVGVILSGITCLFFCYYTIRLIYINIAVPGVAAHRQSGMYIGFAAFPLATIAFGWICLRCLRAAARSRPE
jgi:hypothetical protein